MADTPPRRRRPASTAPRPETEIPTEPPQEARSRPTPPPPVSAPGQGNKTLQNKLQRMIVGIGLPFAAAGDMHCAAIFAQRGPVVAEAWANLAAESPAVKEVLESMLKGGAWTGAIGATIGLVIPVAAHHGAPIPNPAAVLFGIQPHDDTHTSQPEQPAPTPPPVRPESNGHSTYPPGPAAVSLAPTGGEGPDPTDPSNYPGPR